MWHPWDVDQPQTPSPLPSGFKTAVRFAVVLTAALLGTMALVACEPGNANCRADTDCANARCDVDSGTCVACVENGDCGVDEACCNGTCRAGDVEDLCGCAPGVDGATPTSCGNDICLVGNGRATIANVADGVCGCPCDPAQGGTVCTAAVDGDGFSCGCDRQDPVGTCEVAALDEQGIPHRPADTCSPQNQCVCFAAGGVCEGSADCTSNGCIDVVNSATDCGIANRTCADDAQGSSADPRCLGGGCVCNAASDCRGAGLNVDACVFVDDDASQCVCDDYTSDGRPAACPMGLVCQTGGCLFEGTVYGDRDALVAAVAAP